MKDVISLRGVRVNNLQNIDVDIPAGKLTVVTGVSGAGKSSLVFDSLYAEAQRRYLQSFSPFTRQFLERFDQPDADFIGNLPPAIAVSQQWLKPSPRATVGTLTEIFDYLRLLFVRGGTIVCLQCGQQVRRQHSADVLRTIEALEAGRRFSIGFPSRPEIDETPADWWASLRDEGFLRVQIDDQVHRLDETPVWKSAAAAWVLVDRGEAGRSDVQRLTDSIETALARGHGRVAVLADDKQLLFDTRLICPRCDIAYPEPEPRLFHFNDPRGACPVCQGTGVKAREVCPTCEGSRLSELTGYIRLAGKTLAELGRLTIAELDRFLQTPESSLKGQPGCELLIDTIRRRLTYLQAVELGYLTLQRPANTLSGGEAKRVRLTTALGSSLVNALYVFDEPMAGLHARATNKVLGELRQLCDAGNTLVVIEHDANIIRAADWVIDLGPDAGEDGGRVVYQGPPDKLLEQDESETGAFLSGRERVYTAGRRRPMTHGQLRLSGARLHNLQDLSVDFPLGVFCVVTGVSGAGKSSLVQESLYPAVAQQKHKKGTPPVPDDVKLLGTGQINDVILMDQEPLSRTARSNPATYLKVFDEIRKVFADTTDAKVRNFGPGHFSFNQDGGRCETCKGEGTLEVDMQFLADVKITCPECGGRRFRKEVLAVKVRNLSIAEVLDLTVREAFRFFRAQPAIERRLKFLIDVGLDYLRLGQRGETLSGGECQRLKLAAHLASQRKPRCLFLLLEPSAGLHPADVRVLLGCCNRLVEAGHSLILVEHNLDMIAAADHVIDLGPGGGPEGGRIAALGTPEQVAQAPASATGAALQTRLAL